MEAGQLVLFPQLFAACLALLPLNLVQLSVLVLELLSKVCSAGPRPCPCSTTCISVSGTHTYAGCIAEVHACHAASSAHGVQSSLSKVVLSCATMLSPCQPFPQEKPGTSIRPQVHHAV